MRSINIDMDFWSRLTHVTLPTELVVTLDEAKAHLRVTHDDDDDLITNLIKVGTGIVEGKNGIGKALLTQTWRLSMDCLPQLFSIPFGPVQTVDSITYRDCDGEVATLSTDLYRVEMDGDAAVVQRKPNASYPTVEPTVGTVKVTFTTGYGDVDDVPADLKHAVLLLVEKHYDPAADVDAAIEALLSRHRVIVFG